MGEFFVCSLFSSVTEFEDQATVRFVAGHALAALADPANDERAAPRNSAGDTGSKLEQPMSRRDLLRGQFLPGPDDGSGR